MSGDFVTGTKQTTQKEKGEPERMREGGRREKARLTLQEGEKLGVQFLRRDVEILGGDVCD